MKILFIASEVVPFSKTGGLADVAGSLPKALKEIGHDIRIFTPRYKKVKAEKFLPGSEVPVYFYEDEKYFGSREELYQIKGADYPDNLERYSAFCRAALPLVKEMEWKPDIVHCNDWQSALAIAYLKVTYKDDPYFKRTAAVYSIHNMGYLGMFPKEKLPVTGLGFDQFTSDKLEFWDNIALTKAGFVYADVINTVSETYAKEIQTKEFGHGLDGLLKMRAADVYGIINGIDYDVWDPATDKSIAKRYSPATLSLKTENKIELQRQNNLPQKKETPLIGMITRLADQKGFDILAGAIDAVMRENCQLVILGTGDKKYHELLLKIKQKYPDHIGVNLKFDAMLAELIYAGADMFLMPSRYEPCGLGQLISFKYGVIPIVRKTGGLADTVHEFDTKTGEGEGFVFEEYSSKALLSAIKRACEAFHKKTVWKALQEKVTRLDYSWDSSAKKYVSLYMKALARIGIAAMLFAVMVITGCGSSGGATTTTTTSTTTTSTTTTTLPFYVNGTVSPGNLVTAELSAVVLVKSKADVELRKAPITYVLGTLTAGKTFTYSLGTSEAGTYFVAVAHPTTTNETPAWAGGPGVSQDDTLTNMLNVLQPITFESSNRILNGVNFTIYRVTGP